MRADETGVGFCCSTMGNCIGSAGTGTEDDSPLHRQREKVTEGSRQSTIGLCFISQS
jgi:hypothetical protein